MDKIICEVVFQFFGRQHKGHFYIFEGLQDGGGENAGHKSIDSFITNHICSIFIKTNSYKIYKEFITYCCLFFYQLYFLINSMYSLNEILLLLSTSILSKFQFTISSVIVMFKGLNVSSINFLNYALSINSPSSSLPLLSFWDFLARSPKKWWKYSEKVIFPSLSSSILSKCQSS